MPGELIPSGYLYFVKCFEDRIRTTKFRWRFASLIFVGKMLRAFHSLGFGIPLPPLHRWKPYSLHFIPQIPSLPKPTTNPFEFHSQIVFSHSNTSFSAFKMSATRSESNSDADVASPSHSSNYSSPVLPSEGHKPKVGFCQSCGGPTKQVKPEGEEKLRAVCTKCGKIYYENPKMVVGCLVEHNNKVLLCRRKIQPSYGLWTLPAGFLEIGESAAEGATRETLEEACAEVEVLAPFAQLDIPRIGQSYIIFRAKMKKPQFSAGPESLECALFDLDAIPFDSLAFSSISVTLKMYIEDVRAGNFKFHYCTIQKRADSSPSDTRGFILDYHLQS